MTHFDLDVKGSLWLLSGAGDRAAGGHKASGLSEAEVGWPGQADSRGGVTLHCSLGRGTDVRSSLAFEQPCDLGWCSSLVCLFTCKLRLLELTLFREISKQGVARSGLYFRVHLTATHHPLGEGRELARGPVGGSDAVPCGGDGTPACD